MFIYSTEAILYTPVIKIYHQKFKFPLCAVTRLSKFYINLGEILDID